LGGSPRITDTIIINNRSDAIGGGIYCEYDGSSSTIINATIKYNEADKGAGIYLSSSKASISHSIISNNSASSNGGGIYCQYTSAQNSITSSLITQNEADGSGGGIYAYSSSPTITNCVVSGNLAVSGAGLVLSSSEPIITNCTFADNIASHSGGAISYYSYYADRPQAAIKNSILWNNSPDEINAYSNGIPAVSYCNIKGGFVGVENFHGDPLFVDADNSDYRLKPNSPCINTGTIDGAPSEDIEGRLRPQGAGIDIGAYEMASGHSSLPVIDNFAVDISEGDIPFDVVLTCSAHDPEGGEIDYTIDFGDGSATETNLTGIFTHQYTSIGIGDAYCAAANDSGAKANSESITIIRHGIVRVPQDYSTIQAAIDANFDGNTIIVSDGIYTGEGNKNLNLNGKKLILKSENGPENCIIDCEGSGRGFIFENGETHETVISGFTIRNGECLADTTDVCGSAGGGGIYIASSSPSIENCILTQNTAESGGALYADESSAVITNCSFLENTANLDGGGLSLRWSAVSISNCIISRNTAGGYGGGIASASTKTPTSVTNCIISDNSAQTTGGIYASASSQTDVFTVTNSTITRNNSRNPGGALFVDGWISADISNSILWGDTPDEIRAGGYSNLVVKYSDVQRGFAGEGNFHGNPMFSDPESGDFSLTVTSPCIDTGTSTNAPDADIEGTARPQGLAYDLGAYEAPDYAGTRPIIDAYTADNHEGNIPFVVEFSCSAHDPDGQIAGYTIDYDDGSPTDSNSTGTFRHTYTTAGQSYVTCAVSDDNGMTVHSAAIDIKRYGTMKVPSQYETIQAAIDAQFEGGVVQVADGTYTGEGNKNIDFRGKALTLISENGPLETTIDCEGSGTGFIFQNLESEQTRVSGFTVTNGSGYGNEFSTKGGGLYCMKASPQIDNCIIYYNEADRGGGIFCDYMASPKISNSAIITNLAVEGGGLFCGHSSNPEISSSFIAGNGAYNRGGGIFISESDPNLSNSTIVYNASNNSGGAILITNYSSPRVTNCTISENAVFESTGGGIYCDYHSSITVLNSILWKDSPDEIVVSHSSDALVSYSNIQGGFEGEGNISEDPKFADSENIDFHLTFNSPSIDAGNNHFVDNDVMFDDDGDPRVVDGLADGISVVDMGSDEFLDTDRDRLPDYLENDTCTSALDGDSDNDGIIDGLEDGNLNGALDVGETDPCNEDSDGDGLSDGSEDINRNGVVDNGETDPRSKDTDGDELPD